MKPNASDRVKNDAAAGSSERGYLVGEVAQRLGGSLHSLNA